MTDGHTEMSSLGMLFSDSFVNYGGKIIWRIFLRILLFQQQIRKYKLSLGATSADCFYYLCQDTKIFY